MLETKHILKRMSQRGIKKEMLNLALFFGEFKNNKIILDKKNINSLIKNLNNIKQDLMKLNDKGGLVLVLDLNKENMITTYNKGN